MLEEAGVDFKRDILEDFRVGSWFRRATFKKELDAETLARVPEKQRKLDADGRMVVTRSEVRQLRLGMPLSEMPDKLAAVLGDKVQLEEENR